MMRLLTVLIISLISSLSFAEGNKWEISIIDNPNEEFTDFISTEGFGYKSPLETVEHVCGDTDFAPIKLAIHRPENTNIEVYTCEAWRAGNRTPEIRKLFI